MQPLQQIDLLRGWPAPSLLPSAILLQASEQVLGNHTLATPSLLYGPDPGYQPLREAIATWLSGYYKSEWTVPDRICITGGASQNLACILQVFADPSYTKSIYMVAPTYYLACRIFEDNGFAGRLRAVPEDAEGVDVTYLEVCLARDELENGWHEQRVSHDLTCFSIYYMLSKKSRPDQKYVLSQRKSPSKIKDITRTLSTQSQHSPILPGRQ
jgi:DNA-binding transcriptional MocR family regulator